MRRHRRRRRCTHGAVDELRDGGLLLGERRGQAAGRGLEVGLGLRQRRHGAREVGNGGRFHGAQVLLARQRGFEVAALRLERGLGGLELHGAPAVARPRLDLLLAKLLEVDDRAEVAPQPRRLGLDQVAQREALVHARRHQQLVQRAHKVQHGHRLVVQLGVPRQRAAAAAAVAAVVVTAARRAAWPCRVQRLLGNARALVNQLLVHVAHELRVGALAAAADERLVQAQPARRAQAHFAQARADFIGAAIARARGAREGGWAAGAARGREGGRGRLAARGALTAGFFFTDLSSGNEKASGLRAAASAAALLPPIEARTWCMAGNDAMFFVRVRANGKNIVGFFVDVFRRSLHARARAHIRRRRSHHAAPAELCVCSPHV